MKMNYTIFIFIICCYNILCEEKNVKKLECQGIYIYKEKKKKKDFFFEKPHFAIYKHEDSGIYNSNENFNGLSIFIKQKIKNYQKDKKKVFDNFLCRIYYSDHSSSICEEMLLNGNKKIEKNKKKKYFEYISFLNRNIKGLYVNNKCFEKLYKNCSFNINGYINKNCLSHKYILFDWKSERDMKKWENHKNKNEIENKDVWSFIYISKTDLIKSLFAFHIKNFFLYTLKKKNERIYFLFNFFITNNILKDIYVISFIEKVDFDGKTNEAFQEKDFTYKYVFNISFNIYLKNYKSIDNLSFFFSKFYCEDRKNKMFFMNSFLNNKIYIYSKGSNHSITYENNLYSNSVKKNIFLLSYIYSNIRIRNKDENTKKDLFLNYDIKNFPFLVHDNLYYVNDYIIYKEKSNEVISKKTISDVYVNKVVENEGFNKKTKTIINIHTAKNNYDNFFFLKKCKIIVVDLYPNNIIIDKEQTDSHLKFSFVDIEKYKDESSHIITKFENENLFRGINYTNIMSNIRNRLCLNLDNVMAYQCNRISQGKSIDKLYFHKNNFSDYMRKDIYMQYREDISENNHNIIKKSYDEKQKNLNKMRNYLNCNGNNFIFSYETPLHSRYVAPCYRDLKENTNFCTKYDIVIISNAKTFLMCIDNNKNRQNNKLSKIYNYNNYSNEINNYNNFTIFSDSKNVYISKDENILTIHTKDFYIYLNEISFHSFFYRKEEEKRKNDIKSYLEKKENYNEINKNEDENFFYEDNVSFNDFVYVKAKHNKKYKIFNFNKIHNDKKFPHNVIEASDVQKFDIPICYNLYNSKKFNSDIIYIYSIPRGNENYMFILYISSLISFLIIIFTLYISYKFA
ncbi:conserved Plasmodium protein, unknown function [Plasmodium relictum]|uniref:6-cysteine protein n=1 Tax=Plasmodium relictum TaxID=85471 RepID=A0A1J1H4R3_PLARL|nr:conserved Plasmodium protein, unknown function [Plasmodium relictum]CRG99547.1 conserved Plasmodium protein, unknown function [Plasmodium relictum]